MRNIYYSAREKLRELDKRMQIYWNNLRYRQSIEPSKILNTSFLGRDHLLDNMHSKNNH